MICRICGKYSNHTNEIALKKFVVDGISYLYPVCSYDNPNDNRFKPHADAQAQIERIVRDEIKQRQADEEALRVKAKEILEKQQAEIKANEERVAKENEERAYRTAMRNFEQLTQGNKRAIREIAKILKEVENGE